MVKRRKNKKRFADFLKKNIWLIIAIIMIILAICLTFSSYLCENTETKSFLQNFGLGLIASSFVSLFIEIKNYFQVFFKKKELKKSILLELKNETLKLYSKCYAILKKICLDYHYEVLKCNIFSPENLKKYYVIYDKIQEQVENSASLNKKNLKRLDSRLKISRYDVETLFSILNKINFLYYTSTMDSDMYKEFKYVYENAISVNQCNFEKGLSLNQKVKSFNYTLMLCSSSILALQKINFLTEDEIQDVEFN